MNKLMWLVFAQAALLPMCRPGVTSAPSPRPRRSAEVPSSKGAMKHTVASSELPLSTGLKHPEMQRLLKELD